MCSSNFRGKGVSLAAGAEAHIGNVARVFRDTTRNCNIRSFRINKALGLLRSRVEGEVVVDANVRITEGKNGSLVTNESGDDFGRNGSCLRIILHFGSNSGVARCIVFGDIYR